MDVFFRIICPPVEFKAEVTMKKFLLICAALTAFAVPAHAQLFTAWGACDGTAGSSTGNMDFDCTPGSGFSAQIFGTFGVSSPIPNFVAAEGIVDFAFQGASDVPAFWHFEAGGCNANRYRLRVGPRLVHDSVRDDELHHLLWNDGCGLHRWY